MGYHSAAHETEGSNCFCINQLASQTIFTIHIQAIITGSKVNCLLVVTRGATRWSVYLLKHI